MRSNCLAYALKRWWQAGGYVVFRRSHFYPGPHVCWSRDLVTFEAFVPARPRKRIIPPIWFRGHVKHWTGRER